MKISVRRLETDLPLPALQTAGAVGFDLYARTTTVIPAGSHALVPNNLIVRVPEDHVLLIASRSSTLKKKGLMVGNGVGIIDQDYHGPEDELRTLFYNPGKEDIVIERGERWSQALIMPVVRPEFVEDHAPEEHATRGGFGTTGHLT